MSFGYWGKILKVNLTTQTTSVDEPGELFYRRYFGGAGVILYYLLKEMPRGVDALAPENLLIFAPGVLTGTPVSGAGRNCVGTKSPMTGGLAKSEVGGFWGAELKRAGFDAIVVTGRAAKPVYLWIHDGEAEIREASHLWGKETREAQDAIRGELDDRLVRVAQIGPGGENLVRYACVINDLKDAAGRGGTGAVMGSKNLKAIAVRGHQAPAVADAEKVREFGKWLTANYQRLSRSMHEYGTGVALSSFSVAGNLPTRNFRDGFFADATAISAETLKETIGVGMESCYACPIRCKKMVEVKEPYEVDPRYGGPEYETIASFGSNCGVSNLKAIARAHQLCQAYSIDTISTGATIAFAMECFENGLLTLEDTDGLNLRFGNASAMLQMIEWIAQRKGLGDTLAEGSRIAAQRIGLGAEKFAIEVKGLELGMHEPRLKQGLGLGYTVAAVGGDHVAGIHDTLYEKAGSNLTAINPLGFLEPLPANDLGPRKVAMFAHFHQWRLLLDSLVLCLFLPYNHNQVMEITSAVTGWSTSVWDGMKLGERLVTMSRAFNLREGLTAADDRLPERFFAGTTEGALKETGVDRESLENAKRAYYKLMGWDPETGVPDPDKLGELGIEWVGEAL